MKTLEKSLILYSQVCIFDSVWFGMPGRYTQSLKEIMNDAEISSSKSEWFQYEIGLHEGASELLLDILKGGYHQKW